MEKTLGELAAIVGGAVEGDKDIIIRSLNGIKEAGEGDLTFLANPKYSSSALISKASAILIGKDVSLPDNLNQLFQQLMETMPNR